MQDRTFRVAVVVALSATALVTALNTVALGDLEALVIRRSAIDAAPQTQLAPSSQIPGRPTGRKLAGFGGRQADQTWVQGASLASGGPEGKPHPQGGILTFRDPAAPRSLFPFANDAIAQRISSRVLGRLLILDPDQPQNVLPSLALSWDETPDHKRITWHLRRGVQFADGTPFTAADVVYSFECLRDPNVEAGYLRGRLENVDGIEAIDPFTVVMEISEPSWRDALTFGWELRILNQTWFERKTAEIASTHHLTPTSTQPGEPGFAEAFNLIRVPGPGTGPYMLDAPNLDTANGLTLVRNPFAMDSQIHPAWNNIDTLRYEFVPDERTALERVRAGEIDVMSVDHAVWDAELAEDASFRAKVDHFEFDSVFNLASYIVWNHRRPQFADARVRTALGLLVDREFLVREVDRGRGRPAVAPTKPEFPEYPTDLVPLALDPTAASKLLDEAGWVDTDGDGVRDREGTPLRFKLSWGGQRAFYRQVGASLRDQAARVGVVIDLDETDFPSLNSRLGTREFDGAILVAMLPDPWVDPYGWYHSSQDVPGGQNTSGWRSSRVDDAVTRLHQAFDATERLARWHDFNHLFYEEQPVTLLLHGKAGLLVSKRLDGVRITPAGFVDQAAWIR